MIKKTIKYYDYEGNERTDDFYFHLTQVELTKINSDPSLPGGLEESVARASKNTDAGDLLRDDDLFKLSAACESTEFDRCHLLREFHESQAFASVKCLNFDHFYTFRKIDRSEAFTVVKCGKVNFDKT